MKPPRPPYLTPSKSSACISHNWILPHHPSQMTLASNSIEPLPYAKRCSHWCTIYSMTGLPLKTIYPSNFKHFGTFKRSSVLQMAYFWKPLGLLSPLCYAHPCWPRSIIHIGVLNTAFVLPEMLYSGPYFQGHWRILPLLLNLHPIRKAGSCQANVITSHSNSSMAICLPRHICVRAQTVPNHSGPLQWLLRVGWTTHHPTAHSTTATGTADQRDSSSPC